MLLHTLLNVCQMTIAPYLRIFIGYSVPLDIIDEKDICFVVWPWSFVATCSVHAILASNVYEIARIWLYWSPLAKKGVWD